MQQEGKERAGGEVGERKGRVEIEQQEGQGSKGGGIKICYST